MLSKDTFVRDHLAEAVRAAVDDVVTGHAARPTQEPAITSKIAHSIEHSLNHIGIAGYEIRAIAQDIPDRGPGSWEKKSGVDLYIGVEVVSPDYPLGIRKGLLIQGKKSGAFPLDERDRLQRQCENIEQRSRKGGFVWIYTSVGTRVIPASEVLTNPGVDPRELCSRNVGELFRDVLDCFAGDRALVAPSIFDDGASLTGWLREMAVGSGLAISLRRDFEA